MTTLAIATQGLLGGGTGPGTGVGSFVQIGDLVLETRPAALVPARPLVLQPETATRVLVIEEDKKVIRDDD